MKDKFLNPRIMASKSIGLILLFQILSIGLVFIYTQDGLSRNTLYFALALIGITLISNLVSYFLMRADSYLVMISNMLFSIGVIMIYRLENTDVVWKLFRCTKNIGIRWSVIRSTPLNAV